MFLQNSDNDYRLDLETRNKYSMTTCCLRTNKEVDEFVDGII